MRFHQVLRTRCVTKYLGIDDLVPLLMTSCLWTPVVVHALSTLCRKGLAYAVLSALLSAGDTKWKKLNVTLIGSLVRLEAFKDTKLFIDQFANIVLQARSTCDIARLIAKSVSIVPSRYYSVGTHNVLLMAIQRGLHIGDFSKLRSICSWKPYDHLSYSTERRNDTIVDAIASRLTPDDVVDLVCDNISSSNKPIAAPVHCSHLRECCGYVSMSRRLEFLAQRVDAAEWSTKEFRDLLRTTSLRPCNNAGAVGILVKYMDASKWSYRDSRALMDELHSCNGSMDIVGMLKSAGFRPSVVYALRKGCESMINEVMPDIVSNREHMQYFGAVAVSSGNVRALKVLLSLGLKERCSVAEISSLIGVDMEPDDVPLLHLAASRGHGEACQLLIETFADSKCDCVMAEGSPSKWDEPLCRRPTINIVASWVAGLLSLSNCVYDPPKGDTVDDLRRWMSEFWPSTLTVLSGGFRTPGTTYQIAEWVAVGAGHIAVAQNIRSWSSSRRRGRRPYTWLRSLLCF